MSTGTITIGVSQWSVTLATTAVEITQGLSGVASIPVNSGMLFDLGVNYNRVDINMQQMLFPLDIIFMNSVGGVVGVLRGVQPLATNVYYEAGVYPGARYFLEVNSGEATNVVVGDNVVIGVEQDAQITPQFWPALVAAVGALGSIAVIGASTYREIKGGK